MNNMNVDYVTLHYRSVLNDFSNQFLNEEFSDCILNAEGKSLKVHKAMLCAQSTFLEKMILEHQNIGDLYFIIEGISFDDLKCVVQFMYNGCTELNKQNFGSFLVVAELLGVKWLDRLQISGDSESPQMAMMDTDETGKPDDIETQSNAAFRDLTNVIDTKIIKRKKHMKSKKHCKRSKCTKDDHRNDRKKHKVTHLRHNDGQTDKTADSKETHLADMDENTFCNALGLKKNQSQPRDNLKPDSVCKTDAKIFVKSKSVPPLIKINRELKSVEHFESRDSNLFVSEINTVYIEDKNLSFLNIGANELCIRENNIEIECDVLDASSSQFVIDKEPVASIVELREENIIQAEFVDINPACEDSSSYSYSTSVTTTTTSTAAIRDAADCDGAAAATTSASGVCVAQRKSSRPCRRKSCAGRRTSPSGVCTMDKAYADGSTTLFWCDVCQRTYHTKTGLNQHKRYECCKEPAFACPRCEKRFKRKSSLVRHAITLHDEAIFPTRTKLLSKLTAQGDRSILTISGRAAVDIKSDEIEESASEAVSQLDDSDEDIYCCFVGNKATAARELDAATEDASISVAAKRSPTAEPNRSAEGTSASPERIQETPSYVTEFRLRVAEICANLKVPKACAMKQNVNVAAIPVPNEDTSASTNTSPVIAGKRPLEIDYSAEVPKTKEVALISEDLTVDDDDCVIVDECDTSLKRSSGVIVDKDDTSLKRSSAVIDRINSVIIRRAKLTKGRDVEAINVPATPEVDRVTGSVRAIGFGNKALNDAVESSLSKGIESQKQPFASPMTSRNWKRVTNEIAARSDTTNGPAIENDLELDCGVQPLPELAAELNPVPEPASVSGPPKGISSVEKISGVDSTIHRTDEFASLTGRKSVEVAKRRDNVYVPLHKTKIRKSARKKKSPPVDEFQEYIRREFHVTPFTIRLDRYRSEAEKEESKKLNFLSNFNLKKIGSSPIRREHSYFRPPFKIPKRIPSAGCRKSTQNRALLQKKKRKADSFVTVEIVKLDENSYDNDIHEEHSYNYRAHERKLSSDFTLKV